MNYTLTQIASTAIPGIWPTILTGISVLSSEELAGDDGSPEYVFNALLSGHMTLWYCTDKQGIYNGFLLTQISMNCKGQNHCLVYGLYGNGGHLDHSILDSMWGIINSYAVSNNCSKFRMVTRREGLGRLLAPRGWKAIKTIYEKEVL